MARPPPARRAPSPGTGTLSAACCSACAALLAFLCVAAFWLASAWPSGLGAVSITGVVLSLFASRDNPAQAGLNFLRGILLSIPLAGFVALFYLPGVDGFPLLCLGLGVPLFFAALCVNRASLAGIASPVLHLLREERRAEQQHELRPAHFLNNAPCRRCSGWPSPCWCSTWSACGRANAITGACCRPPLRRPGAALPCASPAQAGGLVRRAHCGSPDPPGAALRPFAGGAPPALVGRPDGTRLRRRAALPAAVPGEVPASLAQARDRYLRRCAWRCWAMARGPSVNTPRPADRAPAQGPAASLLAGSERGGAWPAPRWCSCRPPGGRWCPQPCSGWDGAARGPRSPEPGASSAVAGHIDRASPEPLSCAPCDRCPARVKQGSWCVPSEPGQRCPRNGRRIRQPLDDHCAPAWEGAAGSVQRFAREPGDRPDAPTASRRALSDVSCRRLRSSVCLNPGRAGESDGAAQSMNRVFLTPAAVALCGASS